MFRRLVNKLKGQPETHDFIKPTNMDIVNHSKYMKKLKGGRK